MTDRQSEQIIKAPRRFERWGSITGMAAGAISLFTLIGAIMSIIANAFVFWLWGLNFLDIATPSDILMSGIRIWAASIVIIFLAVVLSIPFAAVFYVFDRSLSLAASRVFAILGRMSSTKSSRVIRGAEAVYLFGERTGLAAIAFASTIIFIVFIFSLASENTTIVYSIIAGQVFCFAILIVSNIYYFVVKKYRPVYLSQLEYYVLAMSAIGLIFETFVVTSLAAVPKFAVHGPSAYCKDKIGVIWLGSDSIVARCGPAEGAVRRSDKMLIIRRDDAVLVESS